MIVAFGAAPEKFSVGTKLPAASPAIAVPCPFSSNEGTISCGFSDSNA